ncbi:GGDEF domain-containing protein [Ketobacter sp.]|uniref:GGDEF domain-containing protein n=1 Tax=Ketobacter sp. TaxID=2083498 RepID=UPI0025C33B0B|nr:diguanylate cyclase [Ketobacter sp.]
MNSVETKPRILVVDDDPACVELLLQLLSFETVTVRAAHNGEEALAILAQWVPDLVLLDVTLPGMNGYEVCHQLQQSPRTRDVGVLFLTGMDDVTDEERGLQLGALDYITKPFQFGTLRARIRNHLALQLKTRQLESQAQTDALTRIPNRRCFESALEQEWYRCARHGRPISVMMVDVDFFKQFNDHYGHPMGDACLQQVAAILDQGLNRATDLVARIGGEEFAVLLPEADEADLFMLAEQIRRRVESAGIPHPSGHAAGVVTVSIGCCAMLPELGQSLDTLMLSADNNLYTAKALGRNQVVVACGDSGLS